MSALPEQPDAYLSETDIRQILERAASIEFTQGTISVLELSHIGQEAGFAPAAMAAAIKETLEARALTVATEPTPPYTPPSRTLHERLLNWVSSRKHVLVPAGAAGALGIVSRMVDVDGIGAATLLGMILLAVSTLFRAVHHRPERKQQHFQLEAIGTWAGFTVGWWLGDGTASGGMLFLDVIIWVTCAITGALVVTLGRRPAEAATAPVERGDALSECPPAHSGA